MESNTRTNTYTIVDIRKVVECLAADLAMISQATGLWTRDEVAKTISDVKVFAENGFIDDVRFLLKNSSGAQLRAALYKVSTGAVGWPSDRPGSNLWPRTPDGSLLIILSLNSQWWALSDEQKAQFRAQQNLNYGWGKSTEDTSFMGLSAAVDRRYSSNGYGLERTTYS